MAEPWLLFVTTMPLPRRQSSISYDSLPMQVAARIENEIAKATWRSWLPSERRLTDHLQISRRTVRTALAILIRRGLLQTVKSMGHRIVHRSRAAASDTFTVGLLLPARLYDVRHYTILWIDDLRARLAERGAQLNVYTGSKYFSKRPEAALRSLVTQNPHSIWIAANASLPIQRWFAHGRPPCLISGSTHPGVSLASVDTDHRATCRHAVGVLWRQGHRSIALFTEDSGRVGDMDSEAGFADGLRQFLPGAKPRLIRFTPGVAGAKRALEQMIRSAGAPTAMVIGQARYYLTVVTIMAAHGLRVPHDISLLSRDEEAFFGFVVPEPAHYTIEPSKTSQAILHLLLLHMNKGPTARAVRLMPTFVAGGSIGRSAGSE